ncbi:hypothetical protein VTJ49DRAFT_6598 [Mycothermus thermophilus]|uniref:Uncharacterized protein n=1 Tax=Humicola insolens TaxID=85995 RepID=A0ABR3VIZ1_HUMIN
MITMCDTQIITGLAILICGFIDLGTGISAYHFFLIGLVAWFSNLTHTAGLTLLRQYLHHRPLEKLVRLLSMWALFLMLLVAIVPTVYFNWASSREKVSVALPGSPAICLYSPSHAMFWLEPFSQQDVYWLFVSAIWGTIKLSQVKGSVTLEEEAQCLPWWLVCQLSDYSPNYHMVAKKLF